MFSSFNISLRRTAFINRDTKQVLVACAVPCGKNHTLWMCLYTVVVIHHAYFITNAGNRLPAPKKDKKKERNQSLD